MPRTCTAGRTIIGAEQPLTIIAGPCTLESRELGLEIAQTLHATCVELGLNYIFKASFDKANRSSIGSPRGPGLLRGLEWLQDISEDVQVATTTDFHEPAQAQPVAEIVDLLQIPAFLCRQTDLLLAAGEAAVKHGCGVNVKKGQQLAPGAMAGPVRKLAEAGCDNVMLTERGTFFGYGRLVNDFIGLGDLMALPNAPGGAPPVCFDCTHSTQTPGEAEQTGGRPDRAALLARAAVAAGVPAVFLECHPLPESALSDAATMLRLDDVPALLAELAGIHATVRGANT